MLLENFFDFDTVQDQIAEHQMVYGAVPFNPYAHLSCPSGTTNPAPTFGYSPIHPMAPMGMFTNSYSNGSSNFTLIIFKILSFANFNTGFFFFSAF